MGEDDDADDVRDRLGEALGCEAVDDDAASTSSESDAGEEAPLKTRHVSFFLCRGCPGVQWGV